MIDILYDKMAIPDVCHLGKRVFKRLFYENAPLGVTDKKAFREDIETITWQYAIKPSTVSIQAYEDGQREYHEVHILQVNLKTLKRINRIAEVVHRAIPYPLVVVFVHESTCTLSLAHKRFSQAEKGAIVAEGLLTTGWIEPPTLTLAQRAFLDSLAVSGLPHTHLFAFYAALVDRVIALDCARLSGEYRLESTTERREARERRLAACRELEVRIAEERAAIKAETQFNRQVDLNVKIKRLEARLEQEAAHL